MQTIQTESIANFRDHYEAILPKINSGPILLLQRDELAAILVSPAEWNKLQHYKYLVLLEEAANQIKNGEYFTQAQVEQGLRDRGLID